MTFTDNPVAIALASGIIIYFAYTKFFANNNTTHNNNAAVAANNNHSRSPALAAANAQNNVAANIIPKSALPSRNDDLAALLNQNKAKDWKIVLHTRSKFETISTEILKSATKNHPKLLLCHQLFSDKDEANDVMAIKSNIDKDYFPRDRLVLCTTDKGPEAIARQHEPILFISDNRDLCKFLSAFLTFVVLVDPVNCSKEEGLDVQYLSPSSSGSKNAPNKIYIVKNVSEVLK